MGPLNKTKSFLSLDGTNTGNWADRHRKAIVIAFFAAFMLLAVGIVRDYGISYDEASNRENGYVTMGYLIKLYSPGFYHNHFGGIPDVHRYHDRDYGVFFELPAVLIEYAFGIGNQAHIVYIRHFLTFLVFFIALVFFYRIGLKHFNSWKIGLLGCLMLIISPRIFAQSFYNSKDLVFMSFFLIATYTLLRLLRRRNWQSAALHALACTAAIDTRIMGVLLPAATIGVIVADVIKAPDVKQSFKKWGKLLAVYIIVLVVFVILCWPYLWASPLNNFLDAFHNMSYFRWHHDSLFMGKYIVPSKYIPWYYIPVWIVISTPVLYTLLFLTGTVMVLRDIVKLRFKLYNDEKSRDNLIFLLLFFGPLLAVIILKSVLYDAWRQMYFIYPSFLMLALVGLVRLYNLASGKALYKCGLIAITLISFGFTTAFMKRNHPLEDVYFSCLPDKVAQDNFELDYWALSYQQGLKYILQHDTSKKIIIGYSEFAEISAHILPDTQRKRLDILKFTDTLNNNATWMITNFRFDRVPPGLPKKEVFSVYVDKMKVMSVFKFPKQPPLNGTAPHEHL